MGASLPPEFQAEFRALCDRHNVGAAFYVPKLDAKGEAAGCVMGGDQGAFEALERLVRAGTREIGRARRRPAPAPSADAAAVEAEAPPDRLVSVIEVLELLQLSARAVPAPWGYDFQQNHVSTSPTFVLRGPVPEGQVAGHGHPWLADFKGDEHGSPTFDSGLRGPRPVGAADEREAAKERATVRLVATTRNGLRNLLRSYVAMARLVREGHELADDVAEGLGSGGSTDLMRELLVEWGGSAGAALEEYDRATAIPTEPQNPTTPDSGDSTASPRR